MELFKEFQSGCEADIDQPLLDYLRAKKNNQLVSPYIPYVKLMPIHKLCQQALMWNEAGFVTEAGELAHWLQPLQYFLPLWCPEKEYNQKLAESLFAQLSKIRPIAGKTPDFDVSLLHNSEMMAAFTLSGKGTSLGMIRAGNVEIRALGPQAASLKFGIQGYGMNNWARCSAWPEVWLEVKPTWKESESRLDVRFVGLKPEMPLSFAFYVKAQSCQIGSEILKPKSLRRFNGEAQEIFFQNTLKVASAQCHKVQVIPLAGEGCFWDCEFLLSFELHPFAPQATFSFES